MKKQGMNNYGEALRAFLQRTNEDEVLPRRMKEVLGRWRPLAEGGVRRVLDVGCGPGSRSMEIFDFIRELGNNVSLDGVEPSGEFVSEYSGKIGDRNVRLHNCDFEGFSASGKYDLIVLSHSLYHMGLVETMRKALALMTDGGRMLVAIESRQSQLNGIRRDFYPLLQEGMIGDPVCGDDVMRLLHFLHVPYAMERAGGQYFDVTDAASRQPEKEAVSRLLLQFILHLAEAPDREVMGWAREWLEKNAKTDIESRDIMVPGCQSWMETKVRRYYLEIGDDVIVTE